MNRTYRNRCLRRRFINAAMPWLPLAVAVVAIASLTTAALT